jgi:hypothetical protein
MEKPQKQDADGAANATPWTWNPTQGWELNLADDACLDDIARPPASHAWFDWNGLPFHSFLTAVFIALLLLLFPRSPADEIPPAVRVTFPGRWELDWGLRRDVQADVSGSIVVDRDSDCMAVGSWTLDGRKLIVRVVWVNKLHFHVGPHEEWKFEVDRVERDRIEARWFDTVPVTFTRRKP